MEEGSGPVEEGSCGAADGSNEVVFEPGPPAIGGASEGCLNLRACAE